MRLEVMTWKQAERYFQTHDMAVLPIGSIENHGSHLALGTDFLVPSKIGMMVFVRTPKLPSSLTRKVAC